MNELEREILKFLIQGTAFSDNAVEKNFGIDNETLKGIYSSLEKQGYLEKYSEYQSSNESSCCSGGCSTESKGNCNCSSSQWDEDKILVITEKAIKLFN